MKSGAVEDDKPTRRKPGWNPDPQLSSVDDLAAIRARYVGSKLPAQTAADMEALRIENEERTARRRYG